MGFAGPIIETCDNDLDFIANLDYDRDRQAGPRRRGDSMRVIKKRRLEEFWKSRKNDATVAEARFSNWYKIASARSLRWSNFAELKQTFGTADQVGNCVVFDVGNNLFRLIGRVNYKRGIIYVLKVMDHAEYDKDAWVSDCGCDQPPPKKAPRK
jgi:mRNA interferase HigB